MLQLLRAFASGVTAFMLLTSCLGLLASGPCLWISKWGPSNRVWHMLLAAVFFSATSSFWKPPSETKSTVPTFIACLFGALALWDTRVYYDLLQRQIIRSQVAIPLSAVVVLLCLAWLIVSQSPGARNTYHWTLRGSSASFGFGACLLALIATFGATDYRRKADCAVVLGAAVYRNGRLSLALSDRVQEGIQLYKEGHVPFLIMTGGTGVSGVSEAKAMADAAVKQGVPRAAIILDEEGKNTRHSALNCRRIMKEKGLEKALIVSHYYHLARCKEAFRREGVRCYTVPAHMTRRLGREPYYLLREGVAYLYYALPGVKR